MSYVDTLRDFYAEIEEAMERETDPHRHAILQNYFRHITLESTEHWPAIFDMEPALLVDVPVYRTNIWGHYAIDEGRDAVYRHYELGTAARIVMLEDHKFWVNDWGVASHAIVLRFGTGEDFTREGAEGLDPAGSYVQSFPMGMFWPYAADGRLIGEDVYQLEPATPPVEIAAGSGLTVEQRTEVVWPFLTSWFDPETGAAKG